MSGGPREPRWLELGGRRLEVAMRAPLHPGAPWVVFLHEALGAIATWRDFPERVSEATGCGIVVYSRHGNGRSSALDAPRGRDYLHVEAEQVLPALIDALDLDDLILFGHSDGASIALIHAAKCGGVDGVIVEAPHVFVEPETRRGVATAVTAYETGELRARLAPYHVDVERTFRGWADAWLGPAFQGWNVESLLPSIVCPVLMIQGTRDEYATLAQLDAIERQVAGRVTRVELDCGHAPHREQPKKVLRAVAEFLVSVRRR